MEPEAEGYARALGAAACCAPTRTIQIELVLETVAFACGHFIEDGIDDETEVGGLAAPGVDPFAGEFALRGMSASERGSIAMMQDQMSEKHEDEDGAKGDDDGGAGGGIELNAEPAAQGGNDCAHGPAYG